MFFWYCLDPTYFFLKLLNDHDVKRSLKQRGRALVHSPDGSLCALRTPGGGLESVSLSSGNQEVRCLCGGFVLMNIGVSKERAPLRVHQATSHKLKTV